MRQASSGATIRSLALLALLGTTLPSCASMATGRMDGDGVFTVPGSDPDHPRLRYRDGQVSRNDSCMIRMENGLNFRVPPMYVNGEPVGFC